MQKIMIWCDFMKMTLQEFIGKAEKIDELSVYSTSDNEVYSWSAISNNADINRHLKKILTHNLELTDCIKLTNQKWVKKSTIEEIINIILENIRKVKLTPEEEAILESFKNDYPEFSFLFLIK